MAGERITGGKIEIQYFVGTLATVRSDIQTNSSSPLPTGRQILPDGQSWADYRPVIEGLAFSSRRANSNQGGKREGFGLLQQELRSNHYITEARCCRRF